MKAIHVCILYLAISKNGDGFINRQELGYVMDNLGEKMEKEEIESLINEIDIDGEYSGFTVNVTPLNYFIGDNFR